MYTNTCIYCGKICNTKNCCHEVRVKEYEISKYMYWLCVWLCVCLVCVCGVCLVCVCGVCVGVGVVCSVCVCVCVSVIVCGVYVCGVCVWVWLCVVCMYVACVWCVCVCVVCVLRARVCVCVWCACVVCCVCLPSYQQANYYWILWGGGSLVPPSSRSRSPRSQKDFSTQVLYACLRSYLLQSSRFSFLNGC